MDELQFCAKTALNTATDSTNNNISVQEELNQIAERIRLLSHSLATGEPLQSSSISSVSEDKFISAVENDLSVGPDANWEVVDENLFFPKFMMFKDGSNIGIGKSTGVVQTSPEVSE